MNNQMVAVVNMFDHVEIIKIDGYKVTETGMVRLDTEDGPYVVFKNNVAFTSYKNIENMYKRRNLEGLISSNITSRLEKPFSK